MGRNPFSPSQSPRSPPSNSPAPVSSPESAPPSFFLIYSQLTSFSHSSSSYSFSFATAFGHPSTSELHSPASHENLLSTSPRTTPFWTPLLILPPKGSTIKIYFLDQDGGEWKQGWRVTCKGTEWNDEKLKVFVVPHSHNDLGWKLTVEEYYDRQSRHILDTIVETLSKDNRRKFIWEEMSYLERWWRDASDIKRESFINLVMKGQLEIIGGGWMMNDEAFSQSC